MRYVLLLTILWHVSAGNSRAQTDASKPVLSPFEKKASTIGTATMFQFMQLRYTPGIVAWSKFKMPQQPTLEDFPNELVKTLNDPASKDYESAMRFLQGYLGVVRTCAFDNEHADLDAAARRSLTPHCEAIEKALGSKLSGLDKSIRWKAATILLAIKSDNINANAALTEGGKETEIAAEQCEMIGLMRLSIPSATAILARALNGSENKVREAAATAVFLIGPAAKSVVPELVRLMETGEAAEGFIHLPFSESFPAQGNLGLLALTTLGKHARPAVPALLRILADAKDGGKLAKFDKARFFRTMSGEMETQARDLLTCIAGIGPPAKECAGKIRPLLTNENAELKFLAACTLLQIVPDDEGAAATIIEGLSNKNKEVREKALVACFEISPGTKRVVPIIAELVKDANEDTRISAARALLHFGAEAAPAIPALEKMLTKDFEHNYQAHRDTGYVLGHLGAISQPALIRAAAKGSSGREYAIQALGDMGAEVSPEALTCLTGILADKQDHPMRYMAAIALGRLGEHAKSARSAVVASQGNDDGALMVDWALMEIPE